jgi:peptidoglycan/xylan/chitin deacetylase (PgdA/CDA1 family)
VSNGRALIVTYHAICEGPPPLCQAPGALDEQLELLEGAGFRATPLAQLVDALVEGRPLPARAFALTFDDAYRDFADAALPILERRGVPATLFATASKQREHLPGGLEAELLPLERLAELAERGVEIGAHSVGHTDLTALGDADLERELAECREVLEAHVGRAVPHFAYPFGLYDARVHAAVGRVFRAACTTELARVGPGADPLAIPRVDAHYLGSPLLRRLLKHDRPDPYLRVRRRLRQWRGSEPVVRLGAAALSLAISSSLDAGLAACR